MKKIINVKYSVDRKEDYQIKTIICEDKKGKYVKKEPYSYKSKQHIKNIYKNYQLLSDMGMNVIPSVLMEDEIRFPFVEGVNFAQVLLKDIKNKNLTSLKDNLLRYKNLLLSENLIPFTPTKQFSEIFDFQDTIDAMSHQVANIDLNFENVIVNNDNQFYIIDYEWVFEFPIPLDFVIYRAVTQFYDRYSNLISDFIDIEEIMEILEVNIKNFDIFEGMEKSFINRVTNGWVKQRASYFKPTIPRVQLLETYYEDSVKNEEILQVFWTSNEKFVESQSKRIDVDSANSNYSVDIPDEKILKLRIDPGERPFSLVRLKVYISNKTETLNLLDFLSDISGVHLIQKDNKELVLINLTTDPQLIFKDIEFNKFKNINIEISIKNEKKLIIRELLSQIEQKDALFLESKDELMAVYKKNDANSEMISKLQIEMEESLKVIEDFRQENENLKKINNDILSSKRWKLISLFSNNK